jgi:hypothetical protein
MVNEISSFNKLNGLIRRLVESILNVCDYIEAVPKPTFLYGCEIWTRRNQD